MASKIGDRFLQVRKFAQTAAKHSDHAATVRSEPLKQTKLPNGLIVASIENYSPIARIGVFLRAGSRYETNDTLGITHTLRNAVGLTTKNSSTFAITRNIDYQGGVLNASTTRDNFIYLLENNRQNINDSVNYLIDSVASPSFKQWELEDNLYRLKLDAERHENDAQSQLLECLHRAAFRGGLSNSLFIKQFNVGKYSTEHLLNFTKNHFTANNTVIVGLGVDHDQLVSLVQKDLPLSNSSEVSEPLKSKYIGGDARIPFKTDLTFASVVTEGVGLKNKKEFLALELFARVLGTGPRMNYGNGAGKLQQGLDQVAKEPFKVGALNVSYSDTGLFGFTSITSGKETREVVKLCVAAIRKAAKDFNDADLKVGKTKVKAALFDSLENQSTLLECLGREGSLTGKMSTNEEIEKLIDSITLQDVTSLVNKTIKGKLTIAAIGNLDNMPYAEDLSS